MNAKTLEPTAAFPYLGRTFVFNNRDWLDLYHNPGKALRWWGMVTKVLKRTGKTVRMREIICKVVVHMVLLYGRKI